MKLGDLVFKARNPGDDGYALPDRYKGGSDLRDYYHVGVVTQTNPLNITHMTTPTIKVDTSVGKWHYVGKLKYVDGGEPEPMPVPVDIIISGGNTDLPINMRAKPSSSATLIAQIKQGSPGRLYSSADGWSKVDCGNVTGYVKTEFCHETGGGGDKIVVDRDLLMLMYGILCDILGFPKG